MLTCLPPLHFQLMLISRLVGLSNFARQIIRFYSLLPGQLPMDRLHNSGKSSCGMPSHPQCASWFSHWHTIGSGEEPSLALLELLQGVVFRLFGIARSSRMGGMSGSIANVLFMHVHAHTYTSHLLLGEGSPS